jgi:branched-chain amino acid transport system substrate-binding protein
MKFTHRLFGVSVVASTALVSGIAFAQAGQTVKIGFIDPLSGPFANVGQNQLKSWQFVAEQFSKKNAAGVKFEIVAFDNKASRRKA